MPERHFSSMTLFILSMLSLYWLRLYVLIVSSITMKLFIKQRKLLLLDLHYKYSLVRHSRA